MKRRKVDSEVEKQIITAMIVSKQFLAQAASVIDLALVEGEHFRLIGKWCLDHQKEYSDAPGKDIEKIYHAWSELQEEPTALTDSVHDFLEALSEEHDEKEELNVTYLLDSLAAYLTKRKLCHAKDALEYSLHQGDIETAERAITEYSTVTIGEGAGINALRDDEAVTRAFADPLDPLIIYPGDAGKFFGPAFTRDSLIGIQAPEKRGKTWWCIEFMIRALRGRKRVAIFQVGDLSESQIMLRIGVRLARRPMRKDQCGRIMIPKSIIAPIRQDENAKMERSEHVYTKPLTKQAFIKARDRFVRTNVLGKGPPFLKMGVFANSSINVRGIDGVLQGWEAEEGFIPDVIIIDYADILAPEDPAKQARDQVNDTWKALRRLSQERHALVIAPTQADANSYDIDTQTMKNFSEDKRKLAHVTGMLGLNQKPEEKELQYMRLNWLALRESNFSGGNCLYVGQSIGLGRAFCCGSLWSSAQRADNESEDEDEEN